MFSLWATLAKINKLFQLKSFEHQLWRYIFVQVLVEFLRVWIGPGLTLKLKLALGPLGPGWVSPQAMGSRPCLWTVYVCLFLFYFLVLTCIALVYHTEHLSHLVSWNPQANQLLVWFTDITQTQHIIVSGEWWYTLLRSITAIQIQYFDAPSCISHHLTSRFNSSFFNLDLYFIFCT